jgi:hypothetical protein
MGIYPRNHSVVCRVLARRLAFGLGILHPQSDAATTEATAMDNAEEPYDLITVLSRLEGIEREIGRGHPVRDDDLGATATGRIGLFRKMLRSLRSWRFWTDGSASHKS